MRYAASSALALLALLTLGGPLKGQDAQTAGTTPAPMRLKDAGMVVIDDFSIDRYEYPNQPGLLPKVEVSWQEAQDLCQAAGKRLCLESEWERSCRGTQDYLFAYGPDFASGRCNTPYEENGRWKRHDGLSPSGQFGDCSNDYGLYDMLGNAWEWTATRPGSAQSAALRGGSWFNSVNFARADGRYPRALPPGYRLDLIGFRCCRSLPKAQK